MMGRLLARVVCRWKGHIWVRFFQRGRVALRCTRCATETPGWRITLPPLAPLSRPDRVPLASHARRARP